MNNKKIISSIEAQIAVLSMMKEAAEEGAFFRNANNIVRECRNLRDFSNQLWADWLTAAAEEVKEAECTRSELRI